MTQRSTNVLTHRKTPTANCYLNAVAEIIRRTQGDMTDCEYAERIGVSEGTVQNARNRKAKLSGETLARIGHEFGPAALDPFADMMEAIVIPKRCDATNDMLTIIGMSHGIGTWVDALRDGHRDHQETIALADLFRPIATALQTLIREADEHRKESA